MTTGVPAFPLIIATMSEILLPCTASPSILTITSPTTHWPLRSADPPGVTLTITIWPDGLAAWNEMPTPTASPGAAARPGFAARVSATRRTGTAGSVGPGTRGVIDWVPAAGWRAAGPGPAEVTGGGNCGVLICGRLRETLGRPAEVGLLRRRSSASARRSSSSRRFASSCARGRGRGRGRERGRTCACVRVCGHARVRVCVCVDTHARVHVCMSSVCGLCVCVCCVRMCWELCVCVECCVSVACAFVPVSCVLNANVWSVRVVAVEGLG